MEGFQMVTIYVRAYLQIPLQPGLNLLQSTLWTKIQKKDTLSQLKNTFSQLF